MNARPDTTLVGTRAYASNADALGAVYQAAHDIVCGSLDLASVRRAAVYQALIAKCLGFGRRTVLGHIRCAAWARRAARGST